MVLKINDYFMIVIEPEHIELKVHHWTYLDRYLDRYEVNNRVCAPNIEIILIYFLMRNVFCTRKSLSQMI